MKIILEQTGYLKQHTYHKKNIENTQDKKVEITRKDALKKIDDNDKRLYFNVLGTYIILNLEKA
ncbi:MAG: hypothetical protein ACJAYY_000983 [Paraglaciecola sp.]|jgi:hypothetical protein|uniref:hypothetical protein n=1 Tax=Polaribacter sp. TaxID=1920175 RepID=UPI003ADC72AA